MMCMEESVLLAVKGVRKSELQLEPRYKLQNHRPEMANKPRGWVKFEWGNLMLKPQNTALRGLSPKRLHR